MNKNKHKQAQMWRYFTRLTQDQDQETKKTQSLSLWKRNEPNSNESDDDYTYVSLKDVEVLMFTSTETLASSALPRRGRNGLLPELKKLLFRSVHEPYNSTSRGYWTHSIDAELLYGKGFLTRGYAPAIYERESRNQFPPHCVPDTYASRSEWRGTRIVMLELQALEMYLNCRITQSAWFGCDERLHDVVLLNLRWLHEMISTFMFPLKTMKTVTTTKEPSESFHVYPPLIQEGLPLTPSQSVRPDDHYPKEETLRPM